MAAQAAPGRRRAALLPAMLAPRVWKAGKYFNEAPITQLGPLLLQSACRRAVAHGGILHMHLPARTQRHSAATPCALRARTQARRAQSTALRPEPAPPRQAARPCLPRPTESAAFAVRPHQVGTRLACPHCKEEHTHKNSSLKTMCARHRLQKGLFVGPPSRAPHKRGRGELRSAATARALPSPPSTRGRGARAQAGERGLRRARLGGRTRTHGGRQSRGSLTC